MSDEPDDPQTVDALRRLPFRTTPLTDARILRDATAALRRPRRAWIGRAVAATLMLGAIAGVVAHLDRPTLTMAQVRQAFVAQTWVHVTYDNGREEWTNLVDGTRAVKDLNGRLGRAWLTTPDGERVTFRSGTSFIDKGRWYSGPGTPPRYTPAAEWHQLLAGPGPGTRPATTPTTLPRNAVLSSHERADDVIDGQAVVRFDLYLTDTLGQRWLDRQLWIDPRTRLPVRVRKMLDANDRRELQRDAIVGHYAFPTTGPTSLADLGVPATLPVIDVEAAPADDVAAVVAQGKAAAARFPTRWRLVAWPDGARGGEVDVIYRDGERRSHARWFTNAEIGGPAFPGARATSDEIIRWTATRPPVTQVIADGRRIVQRRNPMRGFANEPPRAVVSAMPFFEEGDDINVPPGAQWSWANRSMAGTTLVDGEPGVPAGLRLLRWSAGEQRRDYWIDPARGFACVREAWEERVEGKWRATRIEALDDFARLPTGDWVAGRKTTRSFGVEGAYRATPHESAFRFDLRPLAADEFPPGTFDGEALMKDADVETR